MTGGTQITARPEPVQQAHHGEAALRPASEAGPAVPSPIRLSGVLGALSYALDLTEGQPQGHSLRCTWIAMQIGQVLSLGHEALSDLYYAVLLKDAGCSSNAARLWELYGGDELTTKGDWKVVDSQSVLQVGLFVLRHAGPGEALRARVQRVLRLSREGDALASELIHTRCERGADIVRQLGLSEAAARGIHALDEHWNGKGRPEGLRGEAIPLIARIALAAQVADVFHAAAGPRAAAAELRRRAGTWFDPRVVEAFDAAAATPGFWEGLSAEGLAARVAALEPVALVLHADEAHLDRITEAFAAIVDAKSSFTGGHSARVAAYTEAIAARLGLPPARRNWLRRAALLHDIGKLGVSNGVLDKPGRLDAAEWAAIRRHPGLSQEILERSVIFRDLAPVAGAHHERLDGTGYPHGLSGAGIPMEARIISVADIFDALTAARPYRGPMPAEEAFGILGRETGTAVDAGCVEALRASPALPGDAAP